MQGDFEKFETLCSQKIIQLVIHPYNLLFMQLNEAMAKKDNKKVRKLLKSFDQIKITDKQKTAVYSKAFYYYFTLGQTERSKERVNEYYQKLSKYEDYDGKEEIDIIFDTFVNGGYKYLGTMLEKYTHARSEEKLECEMLLMNMYTNKGDLEEAKKYSVLAQETIENQGVLKTPQ